MADNITVEIYTGAPQSLDIEYVYPAGPGVLPGGTAGQILTKIDSTNFNTQWSDRTFKVVNVSVEPADEYDPDNIVLHATDLPSIISISRATTTGTYYVEAELPVFTSMADKIRMTGAKVILKSSGDQGGATGGIWLRASYNGDVIWPLSRQSLDNTYYDYGDQETGITFIWNGLQWFAEPIFYPDTDGSNKLPIFTYPDETGQLMVSVKTPTSTFTPTATSIGVAGTTYYSDGYFYMCVATNTWRRTPMGKF